MDSKGYKTRKTDDIGQENSLSNAAEEIEERKSGKRLFYLYTV